MGCPEKVADVPEVLFADDVLLTAKSATGLQELLDIASKWGEDRQMKMERKRREKRSSRIREDKTSDIRTGWKKPREKHPR